MQHKAVFWDRDGVLNELVAERADGKKNVSPQVFNDFKLREGVSHILKQIHNTGYLNIVVTNQPDITRGAMSETELLKMHEYLKKEIPVIDAIAVCPHDDANQCDCRKPKPGLLLTAAKEFSIDLRQSYIVGDSVRDIGAGKAAGCKTIFLKHNEQAVDCNFVINDLKEVLPLII